MKKILASCAVLLLGLGFTNILALNEPANKNLLDPEAFLEDITENTLVTTTSIPVTPGETYTFSMPAQSDGVSVSIHSEEHFDIYVDDDASPPVGNCTKDMYVRSCTFTANKDTLDIEMHGGSIARHFVNYGLDNYQLEQGSVATDYVPYEALETTPPVLGGEGIVMVDYHEPVATETLIDNHVTAVDAIDGDLSDSIVVLSDDYTENKATLGTYPIELSVQDSSGNEATFTLKVNVVDTLDPVIDSVSSLTLDVNSPSDATTIIGQNATFSDGYDGIIEDYTVVNDTYTGYEDVLGDSVIEFEISDASGNKASHTLTLTTEDTEKPVISGPDTQSISQSDLKTAEALFSQYSVSDNHTPTGAITFTLADDTLPSDDASGVYAFTMQAVDESGNKTEKTVPVTLIDDIAPKIKNYSYIKESYVATFDLADYLSKTEVSDNDSELTFEDITVDDTHYQQGKIGTYTVYFEIEDAASNKATHELTIEVVDDIAPVFTFTEAIQTSANTILNETQLNELIVKSDKLEHFDAIDYKVVDDTYTDNASQEGNYVYTVEYMNQKGDTVTSSIDIEVLKISEPLDEEAPSFLPWLVLPGSVLLIGTTLIIKKRK